MCVWMLVAAACGRDQAGQRPEAGGEAIRAKRASVEGFAVLRAHADSKGEALAIAIEFSRPLVGTQDFDALLTFAEPVGKDSSWSLDEGGTVLRFPFVEPNRDYTVRIAGGLTAADGSTLGAMVEKTIFTGELEPSVGFASQGSVLPARESRGLPVVSVNVEEIDVEFLRVPEASLPLFFAQYQRGGRRGSWELDNDYDDEKTPLAQLAEPVYVNRFVLGGERNERMLTYLPVQDIEELQQPGLYFAVMKKAGAFKDQFETAFFTVSDIGLHVRAYKDTLFVHTASLESGAALGGIDLRVLDGQGELVFKGRTDGNGNALLKQALDAGHVLTASKGRDVSMLPFNQPALDLSEFAVAGRSQAWFDVFAWAGRDLYRPGETVRVSALLRDADGMPIAGKDGTPQTLFARLKQPDGKVFVESRIEPGALGYFRFEKAIPVEAPTGKWQVEFRTDPASKDAVQGITLRIEEFLPERMKLDLASA
ncbi:MAG TPA: MG2 domain-containing protein, partial [Luteimonas sp.]|nr:MG2 domain-containing protein [Luteimonas sp.]